ncbi:MAG: hypothetical protein RLY16_120 [Bacteroidota bacterium]
MMNRRRLVNIYIMSFLTLLLIVVACYTILVKNMDRNLQQGDVISTTASQRNLSQELLHLSLDFVYDKAAFSNQDKFPQLLLDLEENHKKLTKHAALQIDVDPIKDSLLLQAGTQISLFKTVINSLVADSLHRKEHLGKLADIQIVFSNSINRLVARLASSSDQNAIYSKKLVTIIIFAILILLMVEVLFVYRPVVNQMGQNEALLLKQNEQLNTLNTELIHTKYFLESTNELASVGGWQLDVATQKLTWTNETKIIHDLPLSYEPQLTTAINFYKEGEHRERIITAVKLAMETGKPYQVEAILVTSGGKEKWVRSKGEVEMQNGVVVRLYGSIQDIQEQKMQAIRLEESVMKYRSLVENSSYAVLLINDKQDIVEANLTAGKIFNYTLDELKMLNLPKILNEESKQSIDRHLSKITANEGLPIEILARKKEGQLFDAELLFNRFVDQHGALMTLLSIRDLTDYKHLQQKIRQTENSLEGILENAPIPIFMKTIEGKYTLINRAFEVVFNVKEAEVLGKREEDFLPEESVEYCMYSDRMVINSGMPQESEETIKRNGNLLILQVTKFLVRDYNGQPMAICGIVRDITASKLAQQKMEESVVKLRKLTDKVKIGIFEFKMQVSGEYGFEFLSKGFEDLCPAAFDDFKDCSTQKIFSLVYTEDLPVLMESIELSRQTLNDWQAEFRYEYRGEIRWLKGASRPEKNADGSVVWFGYLEDITQRRIELERLKLLESVVTHTNDMVVITNADAIQPQIVYVNDAFTRITGYTREEAIGRSPKLLQGPKSDRNQLAALKKAMNEWRSFTVEHINYKKSGEEFWINFTIVPIANEKGWFTHWVAIERDITELKQYIQSIEEKNQKLKEISWMQSHVVRAPLARLMGLMNVLEHYPEQDEKKIIEMVKASAQELDAIIRKIVNQSADLENT